MDSSNCRHLRSKFDAISLIAITPSDGGNQKYSMLATCTLIGTIQKIWEGLRYNTKSMLRMQICIPQDNGRPVLLDFFKGEGREHCFDMSAVIETSPLSTPLDILHTVTMDTFPHAVKCGVDSERYTAKATHREQAAPSQAEQ